MTQDQTLNSLPPYLSDIITRHLYCPTLSRVLGDQQRTRFFFLELRNVVTAFHFLMGFWTEGVISFTVLYQVTDQETEAQTSD